MNILADHSVLSITYDGITFHVANAAMIDAKKGEPKAMPKSLDLFLNNDEIMMMMIIILIKRNL